MATHVKPTAEPARAAKSSTLPAELEASFQQALKLMDGGKLPEAIQAFEDLQVKALAAGLPSLVHGARARLEGLRSRGRKVHTDAPPALQAQVLLTSGSPQEALEVLDKALAAEPGRAPHHYLKAIALVRLDRPAEAAKALAAAIEQEPELRYTFFLESDFDAVRETAHFAPFQLA